MLFLWYSLSGTEQSRHHFLVLRPALIINWMLLRRTLVHEDTTHFGCALSLDLCQVESLIRRNDFRFFELIVRILLFLALPKMLLLIHNDKIRFLISENRIFDHYGLIVYFIDSIYLMFFYNSSLFHEARITANRTSNRASMKTSIIIKCGCGWAYNLLDFDCTSTGWLCKGLSIHSASETSFSWPLWFVKTFNVILQKDHCCG